ncbi:Transmembrane protein 97 [Bulinus truncatus]|nr:Transmembrane protein 97 [Bulinus truncatus]
MMWNSRTMMWSSRPMMWNSRKMMWNSRPMMWNSRPMMWNSRKMMWNSRHIQNKQTRECLNPCKQWSTLEHNQWVWKRQMIRGGINSGSTEPAPLTPGLWEDTEIFSVAMATANQEHRVMDYIIFGYFAFQIPSTLIFDTQGVYSDSLYPSMFKSLRSHYLETYRDPFLADAWKHPWYLSICLVEHFIEMPFFFWAAYVYFYYGAQKKPCVLIPSMLYSVHTITAVLSVWFMAIGADFSHSDALAPRTMGERIKLCTAYAPFFFMSFVILFDSCGLSRKQKLD